MKESAILIIALIIIFFVYRPRPKQKEQKKPSEIELKAEEIARQSMASYLDDVQPLSDDVSNRIYEELYRQALAKLLAEE